MCKGEDASIVCHLSRVSLFPQLGQFELSDGDVESSFRGGSVHQLAWDSTGERLAVAFQPQSGQLPNLSGKKTS